MQRILLLIVLSLTALLASCRDVTPDDTSADDRPSSMGIGTLAVAASPSSNPNPTNTPQLTPLPIPQSSYEASRTSLCIDVGWVLAIGYADFNRDGREDIITAHISGTTEGTPIVMRLQTSNGQFPRNDNLLPNPPPGSVHARKVVIADFNGDGVPDFFIADHGYDQPPFPGAASFLLSSYYGGFSITPIPYIPVGFQHSATAADINGDGALDIFVMDSTNGAFLLMNDGSGSFTINRQLIPTIRQGFYSSEFIDLNDDGFYDLLVGGHEFEGANTWVLWGDASGAFSFARSSIVPGNPVYDIVLDFDAEDLDGDGVRELLVTRTKSTPFYEGYYFQLLQLRNREFVDVSTRIAPDMGSWEGSEANWIAWVILRDFDGDSYLDVVIPEDNCRLVYLNDGQGNFTRRE